ncbi:hypothetical protein AHF37_06417 [Paragonimus kellicotti]|nr:hypothetical protein AHF37_06417 [Paragonimus kellicotti]
MPSKTDELFNGPPSDESYPRNVRRIIMRWKLIIHISHCRSRFRTEHGLKNLKSFGNPNWVHKSCLQL